MKSLRCATQTMQLMSLFRPTRLSRTQGGRFFSTSGNPAEAADSAENANTDLEKKLQNDIAKLTEQVKSLEEKNNDYLDKYKRSLADGENLRQRLNKQINDAKLFGIQSFCKDLLEVADNLGHATNAVPQDQLNASNPHLKGLFDGLVLTRNSLEQVFRRHGLETIEPLNTKFDPNFHEALFQKECKDVEPGMVVEVTKTGYKLHDRCIRPALVGVSRD